RLLEPIVGDRPTVRVLTLLGNTYRQLGRYNEAHEQLERALAIAPHDASILYGLGRTSLAQGDFEVAASWFDQALAAGAPSAIGCDLGLAEYCASRDDAALQTLQKVTRVLQIEPHRQWLANALLCLLLSRRDPDFIHALQASVSTNGQSIGTALRANLTRTAGGRAYWEAEAERHGATPYGAALHTTLAVFNQISLNEGDNHAIRNPTAL
ncbi:MAG: tetratricopeptide repeat protein, partial [Aggregatilineales bacterium]